MRTWTIVIGVMCVPILTGINSCDIPWRRDVNWVNALVLGVDGGPGHIGVDLIMDFKGTGYVPCHHQDEPFFDACIMSRSARASGPGAVSYYKVFSWAGTAFSFENGLFFPNEDENHCLDCTNLDPNPSDPAHGCTDLGNLPPPPLGCSTNPAHIRHWFANKVTRAGLEFYSRSSLYGGVRTEVPNFDYLANGGAYSGLIGTVRLPRVSDPGMQRMNGFVWEAGRVVGADRVEIDFFGQDHFIISDTGWTGVSFASTTTKADGYYSSGPLKTGCYDLRIADRQKAQQACTFLQILPAFDRLDLDLSATCFGLSHHGAPITHCPCPPISTPGCSA